MNRRATGRIGLVAALAMVAAGTVWAAGAEAAGPPAAPEQAPSCTWRAIGNAGKAVYYAAGAMDTDNNHLYLYGGLDQALEAQSSVQRIDLSGTDITGAPHTTVTGVPALRRFGAAGAYRSRGDDSAAFFIGGAGDVLSGSGTNVVQTYNVKTKQWSALGTSGILEDRLFAAAAYDPLHDAIWIAGGISRCGLSDATSGNCPARSMPTRVLTFDPGTGTATWSQLSGTGPALVYGHTMVYDGTGKRLLLVGGTRDGRVGSNDVWQLDLSEPDDPMKATWSQMATGGQSLPRIALHGAAMDEEHNRLVVYGGVTSNFNTPGENIPTSTFALDLGQSPPAWIDLGLSLQQRVGPVMEYSPLHRTVVLNGGRRVSKAQPPQDVERDSNALVCSDQPTVIPPPSTPPTPVPTALTPPPTSIPPPSTPVTPVVPTPPTQPPSSAQVCTFVQRFNRVPPAAIASAMANPGSISGWNKRCNPGVPASAANPERRFLSLHNINKPYHPMFNGLVFRCGCP